MNQENNHILSVVIPAHNEEEYIAITIKQLVEKLYENDIAHEILVVNDHSTDKTEDILINLTKELPNVRYINNNGKNGYGFTVISGLNNFTGDYVAVMMADGSDDPDDLVRFYRKILEGYDCVFGTRFHKDSKIVDYPILKLLFNRMGNFIIQMLFLKSYNDCTNAFKMFKRTTIEGLKPFLSHSFNLTVELPLKAIIRNYTYVVIPNNWYNRKYGVSKFKIKEFCPEYFFIILYCFLEKLLIKNVFQKN